MRCPPFPSLRASCAFLAAAASLSIASAQSFTNYFRADYVEGQSNITTPQLTILKSKSGTSSSINQDDNETLLDYTSFVATSSDFPGATVIGLTLSNLRMTNGTDFFPVYLDSLSMSWDYRKNWLYDGLDRPVHQNVYVLEDQSKDQKFINCYGYGGAWSSAGYMSMLLGKRGRNPDYFRPGDELSLLFVSSYAQNIVEGTLSANAILNDTYYLGGYVSVPIFRPAFDPNVVPEPGTMAFALLTGAGLLIRQIRRPGRSS